MMTGVRKEKGLSYSCVLLIVIAGMERFAFKGVASNLVTYLSDVMKMKNSTAAKTVNSWGGFTSILPLLIAPFADSYLHRFTTILSSSFLYVLGLVALTSSAWSSEEKKGKSTTTFLFFSLCLISLGQGGYNSSLQAFGADQLDEDDDVTKSPSSAGPTEDDDVTKSSSSSSGAGPTTKEDDEGNSKSFFFQCWYMGVCGGSLLGVTVMSYIQDTSGWVPGFAIPAGAMFVSVLFFASGTNIYVYKQGRTTTTPKYHCDDNNNNNPISKNKSAVSLLVRSLKAAAMRILMIRGRISVDRIVELELQDQKPLCRGNPEEEERGSEISDDETSKTMAENAKAVLRLLPIWTTLLTFAVIFQLPATFFTKQGATMRRHVGRTFQIPPATLQSSITLSIILLMPLYDRLLIPLARALTRRRAGITVTQRIGAGMLLSVAAMAVAAVVETRRRARSMSPGPPMSIFWLLPQYVLLGISDIFTVVGMQEFFYTEVPARMRTMAFALYNGVFGVGSFLSAVLITAVEELTSGGGGSEERESWFSDDMSEARLDKYYWLLALLSVVSFALYGLCCSFFRSRKDSEAFAALNSA